MRRHVTILPDGSEMIIEPVDPSLTPKEALQKAMDDCPLCQAERAARARGEPFAEDALDDHAMEITARAMRAAANRAANAARPEPVRVPNWWHGRRRRRNPG